MSAGSGSKNTAAPALGPKEMYLIAYNTLCCCGWMMVLLLTVRSLATGIFSEGMSLARAMANAYYSSSNLGTLLTISQSAAVMEIVHAALGLVRSPVLVTSMQVGSRIVALVAVAYSTKAQSQWGAALMILSWASVEVPRYAFYVVAIVTGDATKKTPFPLFWLRYSLFAVLYPTGITGELTVFFAAGKDPDFVRTFTVLATVLYCWLLPVVYFFGSPVMILNMVGNRKSAFKKRFAKPPPPPRGLVWPLDKKGQRSSTDTNKAVVAAAVGAVNPERAEKILRCKNWRFGYNAFLKGMVQDQCQSPEAALKVAQAGLDKAYETFEFVAEDGSAVSIGEVMGAKKSKEQFFYTGVIQGRQKERATELQVPYKGQTLSGQKLKDQIKAWVDYGTIEPSAGEAMTKCVDHPEWLDLSKRYFVLLGAGSAMGPLLVLLALGANVIAIDLDRPNIWKRLLSLAKESPGSITFPLRVDPKTCQSTDEMCDAAGCNLFTHTPMIRDWLLQLYPGQPFTVGCYAYLDGAPHVQVSLAMDCICRDLSEKRKNTSLAYLCTPTDLHLIPKEAYDAAVASFEVYKTKPYCSALNALSGGKLLRKNFDKPVPGQGGDYYLVNGISVAQGPNYALAKRMQHWRAIIARSKGCVVSSNVAPSTSTVSVVHNRTFAWAYEGMPYFRPFEIFAPETSNAVMSAILLYDLNDEASAGNPKNNKELGNPNQLFSFGSFHGGLWRCAYEVDSIGEASVLLYFARLANPYAPYVAGGLVAAIAAAFAGVFFG